MPDPADEHDNQATTRGPDPGRARLREALRPQVSRAQAVVGILLAIVGFLAIVQIRDQEAAGGEFAGARREDLLQLLDQLDSAGARARAEVQDLEERRRDLRSSADSRRSAIAEARDQVEMLGLLAGTVPAHGRGIVVRIEDPQHTIGTSTLLNAMEELRDAGAEAIEINNSVRVVAQSALVDVEGGIEVDGQAIRPPFLVEVIGDSHTLREAVLFPGGLQDEVERLQGTVSISASDDVRVESLYSRPAPEFASPAPDDQG
ncbi:MAG: DUF881 domain-containing protein [Nocardioidaceae bacterium]